MIKTICSVKFTNATHITYVEKEIQLPAFPHPQMEIEMGIDETYEIKSMYWCVWDATLYIEFKQIRLCSESDLVTLFADLQKDGWSGNGVHPL